MEDLIQILKEISHIFRRKDLDEYHDVISFHPESLKIMSTLLTYDYPRAIESKTITMSQAIELLGDTCETLYNMTCDEQSIEVIYNNFDILNILKILLTRYFLADDMLQSKEQLLSKNAQELRARSTCLSKMLLLTLNIL